MDRAVGRILRRYQGMTLEAWRNLSENDKFEYLAYDREYQDRIDQLTEPFYDKIREGDGINVEAFFSLIIESL